MYSVVVWLSIFRHILPIDISVKIEFLNLISAMLDSVIKMEYTRFVLGFLLVTLLVLLLFAHLKFIIRRSCCRK